MNKRYLLAIDQGTTSSRAIAFTFDGRIVAQAQVPLTQHYPAPGWVEHDPEELWQSVVAAVGEVLLTVPAEEIAAIGVANQRETVLVWERATGKPICNAIVWQCRRTADFCARLAPQERMLVAKTGLPADPYFSASKLRWILDHVEGARTRARQGELCFGTVDCYLLWRMTNGKVFATDYTNAARTQLYNIHDMCWDSDLLKLFEIPRVMLPAVYPSAHRYGATDEFGSKIPVCAMVGDQQGALFGQMCFSAGDCKTTYGTGCFLLMNTGKTPVASQSGLVTTLAAGADARPDYVLEGSVFTAGASVQWLRDEMRLIDTAAESEAVARSVPDSLGVYVVPAFTGLGAPYWDSTARGLITGLTRGAGRAHIVRATLESVAYQVFDVVHAMERDIGTPIRSLRVDGGASANDFLMQFQADILGANVLRPAVVETTALGAAMLAGLSERVFTGTDELLARDRVTTFSPTIDAQTRSAKILGWKEAVARARSK